MPLNLNTNEVTGVDLNNTEVSEVRLNGDTVFTAGPTLPVAFSDMIAWYPMESNISGGDEYSDATALFPGAADSTAYDLGDNGAIYEANEGVTDINLGASSGAFENDTGNQFLTSSVPLSTPITITFWYTWDGQTGNKAYLTGTYKSTSDWLYYQVEDPRWHFENGDNLFAGSTTPNVFHHAALSVDSNGNALAVHDRNSTDTGNVNISNATLEILRIGNDDGFDAESYIDDYRVYNTDLSLAQIQQIYDNTEP